MLGVIFPLSGGFEYKGFFPANMTGGSYSVRTPATFMNKGLKNASGQSVPLDHKMSNHT